MRDMGPLEFFGTLAECKEWLTGWIARSSHDRPALAVLDAVKEVLHGR